MGGVEENGLPSQAELRSPITTKEIDRVKPHCLFISAAMGDNAGIRGIKQGLESEYGLGNVDAFNCILNFKDPQNPQRFEQMADIIQRHAREGLDIVTHSLGAAELRRAIIKVKERDAGFFDNKKNTENLNIVLISPSGFNKGIVGALKYVGRTIVFNRQEGSWPVFSKGATLRRGIDALTAFPPDGISPIDLAQALREAMPEISQGREGIEKVTSEEGRNYVPHLSEAQRKQAAIYSGMIRSAIENRNYDGLRYLVASYGKLLKKDLDEVYAGNFDSVTSQDLEINEAIKSTVGGRIELLRILNYSLGSVPMKELELLQEQGARVSFVVPEYDMLLKLDQITSSRNKVIAEGRAHQFPGLQGNQLGKLVKNVLKVETH